VVLSIIPPLDPVDFTLMTCFPGAIGLSIDTQPCPTD